MNYKLINNCIRNNSKYLTNVRIWSYILEDLCQSFDIVGKSKNTINWTDNRISELISLNKLPIGFENCVLLDNFNEAIDLAAQDFLEKFKDNININNLNRDLTKLYASQQKFISYPYDSKNIQTPLSNCLRDCFIEFCAPENFKEKNLIMSMQKKDNFNNASKEIISCINKLKNKFVINYVTKIDNKTGIKTIIITLDSKSFNR